MHYLQIFLVTAIWRGKVIQILHLYLFIILFFNVWKGSIIKYLKKGLHKQNDIYNKVNIMNNTSIWLNIILQQIIYKLVLKKVTLH